MNNREEMRLNEAWRHMESSIEQPSVPAIPDMQVKEGSIKIIKVVDGDTTVDSEGPSGDGWNEPHDPGYYSETKTVDAEVSVEIVTSEGLPVEITDDNEDILENYLNPKVSDDLTEYIIPSIDAHAGGVFRGFKTEDISFSVWSLGGNLVKILIRVECVNDEAPEADYGGDDFGDDFDSSLLPESKKRKLLDVAGKLLKEAQSRLK